MANSHPGTLGPWTWDQRAKEALLPVLGPAATERAMKEVKGCQSAHFYVPKGRAFEAAQALSATQPDPGYCAAYSVRAISTTRIVLSAVPNTAS